MEIGDARWENLLAYCKLTELADDPEVQALIPGLYRAAVSYLNAEGRDGTDERYTLAVNGLVLHWYDHRGDIITGTIVSEIPLGLRQLINQLKLEQPGCV